MREREREREREGICDGELRNTITKGQSLALKIGCQSKMELSKIKILINPKQSYKKEKKVLQKKQENWNK